MVSTRTINWFAIALKACRLLLVVGVATAARLSFRASPSTPHVHARATDAASPPSATPTPKDLSWYAPLWERDLKSLPAKPPTPAPTPQGPVPTLLATFVEPGARFVHLLDARGRLQFRAVGESVDRFVVAAVEPGRVQLQDDHERFWLEMPSPRSLP